LPLGVVEDPRLANATELIRFDRPIMQFAPLGHLFAARALQLDSKGDVRGALDHLDTAFALSRQLRSFASAPVMRAGAAAEQSALAALYLLLEKGSLKDGLLKEAQVMLQRHEAAVPDPLDSTKADYLILSRFRQTTIEGPPVAKVLHSIAVIVPWEKERQTRIFRAMAQAAIRATHQPGFSKQRPWHALESLAAALPPAEGPGSDISAAQWGEFIQQAGQNTLWWEMDWPRSISMQSLVNVRASEIVLALWAYQADHGSPPKTLGELVPAFMPALPPDPLTGEPFNYRVATRTETAEAQNAFLPSRSFVLKSGQAVVWSGDYVINLYPVPIKAK
jgi:hypothetical protein